MRSQLRANHPFKNMVGQKKRKKRESTFPLFVVVVVRLFFEEITFFYHQNSAAVYPQILSFLAVWVLKRSTPHISTRSVHPATQPQKHPHLKKYKNVLITNQITEKCENLTFGEQLQSAQLTELHCCPWC